MGTFHDLTGRPFGLLTALRRVGNDKQGHVIWLCRCVEGNEVEVRGDSLESGHIKSCGCLNQEMRAARRGPKHSNFKHGHGSRRDKNATYKTWCMLIQRCTNSNNSDWLRYGGANPPVTVCDRWRDFQNFLTDLGERPEGMTLSRYLDTGNYELGNVEWGTKADQVAEAKGKRAMLALRAVHMRLAA